MDISHELISQFVKITNDTNKNKTSTNKLYGTIVMEDDIPYVKMDGSDILTPVDNTVHVKDGERVMVTIKNHSVIVEGNFTDIAASNEVVTNIGGTVGDVTDVIDYMFLDVNESINDLNAETDRLDESIMNLSDEMNDELENRVKTSELGNMITTNAAQFGIFHYIFETEIVANLSDDKVIALPTEISKKVGTKYIVMLDVKSYDLDETVIIKQQCLHVDTKTDESFNIKTNIVGYDLSTQTTTTTGSVTIKYTVLA